MIKMNKQFTQAVIQALFHILDMKGGQKKMASLQDIEQFLFAQQVPFFIPVRTTLDALIQKKYVTYYVNEKGIIYFGLTKASWDTMDSIHQTEEVTA